jgi:hypothetical protein
MMSFYNDIMDEIREIEDLLFSGWHHLQPTTRLGIGLIVVLGLLLGGSKVERTGWSTVLMLTSFGVLTYMLALGYTLLR